MSTIVQRLVKGSALTFQEGDANFNNLNTDKAELTDLASNSTGKGASLIGIEDSAGLFTATTVEGALQELAPTNYFAFNRNNVSPNDTTPAHQVIADGVESNIDAVFAPKGLGALLTAIPDNTSTGGNKRGIYAVDLQLRRTNAEHVASGNYSFVAGKWNTSGGDSSFCMGAGNDAYGDFSVSFGTSADDRGVNNKDVFGGGNFSLLGDCQYAALPVSALTTTATATKLSVDQQVVAADNVAVLPDDHTYAVTATVTARDTSTGDSAHWVVQGTVKRGTGVAATALVGTPSISTLALDAGALTWTVALVADTTFGAAAIQVTGEVGKTLHWVSKFNTVEVG